VDGATLAASNCPPAPTLNGLCGGSSLGVTQSALTTDIGFAPGLVFGDEGSAAFAFWGVLGGVLGAAGCFGVA